MSFLGTEWTPAPSDCDEAQNHKAWVKFFIDRITLFKVSENVDEFFLVTETLREMPHQVVEWNSLLLIEETKEMTTCK